MQLVLNPYAWSRQASMLFVDSPLRTGFSSVSASLTPPAGGLPSSDALSTEQHLAILQGFFARFPEHRQQKLYLSGQSYAGRGGGEGRGDAHS